MHWIVVAVAAAVVVTLRRPDVVTDPKLWGEDGAIFLPQSYLLGTRAIIEPYAGYFLLVPRLWAAVATVLPVEHLPFVYGAGALAFAVACMSIVLSRRLRWLVPSDGIRLATFIVLLLLPGTSEIHGTLTNSVWYAVVCLLLLSLCEEPASRAGSLAEAASVGVLGFTGVGIALVVPAFLMRLWRARTRYNGALVAVVVTVGGVQGYLASSNPRPAPPFEASAGEVLSGLIVRPAGTLAMGEQWVSEVYQGFSSQAWLWGAATVVLLTAVCCARAVKRRMWVPLAAVAVLNAVLSAVRLGGNLEETSENIAHGRYMVIPIVTLVLVLSAGIPVLLRRGGLLPKVIGMMGIGLIVVGVAGDGRMPAYPSIGWSKSADCIARQRECHVPLNPPGWSVDLPPLPNATR